jgi:predicted phosphodiesterase
MVGAAALTAAEKIAGGPFVVNATSRSATVVWIVRTGEVTLQPPDGAEQRTSPSLRIEKTTLTGLKPNTHYDYGVAGQDAGKGSFKTAPSSSDPAPYQFVVYGDTRTRHDVHRRVMEAIGKRETPDFILHTGDLVADGNNTSLWPVFFDIERDLLRHATFFPTLGNHERNASYFRDLFQEDGPYYSFNWGNGHFIVMNSDIANAASSAREKDAFWAEQTHWLEDDLQAHQTADYRFVIAHHPPFTAVSRRQGNNPHMTALVPMFEKYHVSAAFFGHDHNYQHYLKNGVHYIVTGGGGAPLYDVDKPADGITVKVAKTENFVTVKVDGKSAHIEAMAVDGTDLDQIELHGGTQ